MKSEIEASWRTLLSDEFNKPYFKSLTANVNNAYEQENVWPKREDLFRSLASCPLENTKVVILGQDPFPTPGHAHGLCFSNPENIIPFSKSLNNIFKEIKTDLGITPPEHGNLQRWADQGVLLLNTILTVKAHEANSHKKFGWQQFTDQLIIKLSEQKSDLVFLLWGTQAHKKADLIDQKKHHLLKSVHPSPLSAYRGFFGCKHFSKANELLISRGLESIKW